MTEISLIVTLNNNFTQIDQCWPVTQYHMLCFSILVIHSYAPGMETRMPQRQQSPTKWLFLVYKGHGQGHNVNNPPYKAQAIDNEGKWGAGLVPPLPPFPIIIRLPVL